MNEKTQQEAYKRLELLGFNKDVIAQYKDNGYKPINVGTVAVESLDDIVDKLNKENMNVFAYFLCYSPFGTMLNCLTVSPYEEDWHIEQESYEQKCPLCYVYNITDPMLSDMGSIGIELISNDKFAIRKW